MDTLRRCAECNWLSLNTKESEMLTTRGEVLCKDCRRICEDCRLIGCEQEDFSEDNTTCRHCTAFQCREAN